MACTMKRAEAGPMAPSIRATVTWEASDIPTTIMADKTNKNIFFIIASFPEYRILNANLELGSKNSSKFYIPNSVFSSAGRQY
jgi:hypothetical protein